MKISRFFGANSREVMRQVRQVLGPDALIVSNRSVDGGIEVLATLEGAFDDVPQETPRQAAEPASQPPVRHAPPAGAAPQPSYAAPQPAYAAAQPAYAAPARSIAAYQSAYASSTLPEQDDVPAPVARQAPPPAVPAVVEPPAAPAVPVTVSYTHLTLPTSCSACRSRW